MGGFGLAAYTSSKGAVRLLTKATAVQYGKAKIRCNSIHPGPIDTNMMDVARDNPAMMDAMMAQVPMGRIGQPEEVANCALFLASEDSSHMTGSELVVDGGMLAS